MFSIVSRSSRDQLIEQIIFQGLQLTRLFLVPDSCSHSNTKRSLTAHAQTSCPQCPWWAPITLDIVRSFVVGRRRLCLLSSQGHTKQYYTDLRGLAFLRSYSVYRKCKITEYAPSNNSYPTLRNAYNVKETVKVKAFSG